MRFIFVVLCQVVVATAAIANPVAQKAVDARTAFERWAKAQDVPNAGFIIFHDGEVVGAPVNADVPVEMASLSKAITAVCAATLIADGIWQPETTSAKVLGFGS